MIGFVITAIGSVISWWFGFVNDQQARWLNPIASEFVDPSIVQWPWLIWLLCLLSVAFITPLVIFVLLYATALTMYIYGHRRELAVDVRLTEVVSKKDWRGLLYLMVIIWEAHGRIWHGYEIEGFDKIPKSGPALVVYYHGALPLDNYYFGIKCLLYKNRLIRAVGDHFLFMLPGWRTLMKELKVLDGPADDCVKILRDGHILSVAPGGVREAQFGDERYKLIWKDRVGFARVAIEAKAPIIPMFTMNIREAFVSMKTGRCCLRRLYEKTKLPVVPIYGGFPVKLKTFIGDPIAFDPNTTPEELAKKTADAVSRLIQQHQQLPGNIFQALVDRFRSEDELDRRKSGISNGCMCRNGKKMQ